MDLQWWKGAYLGIKEVRSTMIGQLTSILHAITDLLYGHNIYCLVHSYLEHICCWVLLLFLEA